MSLPAEDSMASKWCNAKFLQIHADEEKADYSSSNNLRVSKLSANLYYYYSLRQRCLSLRFGFVLYSDTIYII